MKMGKIPALSIIGYLIEKGCSMKTINKAGQSVSDVLLEKGFTNDVIEILEEFSARIHPDGGEDSESCQIKCMGPGECDQDPIFRHSCEHKGTRTMCSKCFLLTISEQKCGCSGEEIISIINNCKSKNSDGCYIEEEFIQLDGLGYKEEEPDELDVSSHNSDEGEEEEEDDEDEEGIPGYELNWVDDGTDKGYLEDQLGNTYHWSEMRQDGVMDYRCIKSAGLSTQNRCTAVARRRMLSEPQGSCTILLLSLHKHPLQKRKMSDECDSGNLFQYSV